MVRFAKKQSPHVDVVGDNVVTMQQDFNAARERDDAKKQSPHVSETHLQ